VGGLAAICLKRESADYGKVCVVQPKSNDLTSNRTYQIALTSAVLLFLATLTVAILAILIARAREEDRQVEFDLTLTALFNDRHSTPTAPFGTATPAPVVIAGQYAYGMPSGPVYSAAETCDHQIVTGTVLDQSRRPMDAYQVKVWGDYSPLVFLRIGEVEPGWWGLRLDGMINRRLWVQLVDENRYLSAPVEVVFSGDDCERNRVEVDFRENGP
jgi:hypothetical protein